MSPSQEHYCADEHRTTQSMTVLVNGDVKGESDEGGGGGGCFFFFGGGGGEISWC